MNYQLLMKKYSIPKKHIELIKGLKVSPELLEILGNNEMFHLKKDSKVSKVYQELNWITFSDLFKANDLEELKNDLSFLIGMILIEYRKSCHSDFHSKWAKPYYNEIDAIKNLLKKEGGSVKEITFRTIDQKLSFKNDVIIKWVLEKMAEKFLNPNAFFIQYDIDYKSKGRPKSKRVQALKKICLVLSSYLDKQNKLAPVKGKKISDKRRKFLANFLMSIGIISDDDFQSNPKDYINSLLQ